MKTTFLPKLILACVSLLLTLAVMPSTQITAYAQSKMSAPVTGQDLKVAYFPGGRFELTGPGSWTEYDNNGVRRYTFREVRRDAETVYLREDTIGVDLELNATRRVIMGAWPGMARHQLYRMGSINAGPRAGSPRLVPPPKPATIPTPSPQPVPNPVLTTSSNLSSLSYQGGRFEEAGAGSGVWTEFKNSGGVTTYDKLGHDEDTVYLYDKARNNFVLLDVKRQMIRQSRNGDAIMDSGKAYQLDPRKDIGSGRPDYTLSNSERIECLAAGGIVEKAGLLGAQRCTKRYGDGGQVCTDSAQCQGKCMAELAGANQESTSGICQRTDNPFGCYATVENGRTGPALCVD